MVTMAQTLNHGTYTGYWYGCRCPECREAKRIYQLERSALGGRRVGAPVTEIVDRIGKDWMNEGSCRPHPTEWWFDIHPHSAIYKQAVNICANCPVRVTCLEWALQWPVHDLHGIWGGTSQRERLRITDQRKAPTCPTPITLRTKGQLSGITSNKR